MAFGQEKFRSSFPAFGVRVRVRSVLQSTQQYLFTGDDCDAGALVRLAEQFCTFVAQLTFQNFGVRRDLEHSVPAVLRNIRLGFWALAARAATDAAHLLGFAGSHGLAPRPLCSEAADLARRIAERCEEAHRRVRRQGLTADFIHETERVTREFYLRNDARRFYGRAQEAEEYEYERHHGTVDVPRARGGCRA
jgi:hypothetical protein